MNLANIVLTGLGIFLFTGCTIDVQRVGTDCPDQLPVDGAPCAREMNCSARYDSCDAQLRRVVCNGQTWEVEAESAACRDSGSPPLPDGGADTRTSGNETSTPESEVGACCPRDPTPSSCMRLGGAAREGANPCAVACDFWCTTNWRVERDRSGCELWRYDARSRAEGENDLCLPIGDAGDGSEDADASDDAEVDADADVDADAEVDADADVDADAEVDADSDVPSQCCPIDSTLSGCTRIGGSRINGQCPILCDAFCSTGWHVAKNADGCDVWQFTQRAPLPNENDLCLPRPDAGPGNP